MAVVVYRTRTGTVVTQPAARLRDPEFVAKAKTLALRLWPRRERRGASRALAKAQRRAAREAREAST